MKRNDADRSSCNFGFRVSPSVVLLVCTDEVIKDPTWLQVFKKLNSTPGKAHPIHRSSLHNSSLNKEACEVSRKYFLLQELEVSSTLGY